MMIERGATWTIILAAGEGTRLSGVTTNADGGYTPKQFCRLHGGRSLLGHALARAGRHVPGRRVIVIVAADHARWWREELADLPSENVIVQPANRGTALGILLPLVTILERDPEARIIVMASDHYVRDEATLAAAFRVALDGLETQAAPVTLLGMAPDTPETDYGWVLPGATATVGTQSVRCFVEKPTPDLAQRLHAAGGVWNSFLFVARGRDLFDLCRWRLPAVADAIVSARRLPDLGALYDRIAPADFSRDVLQGAERELRLLTVPPCGWTDLGTPARLVACLADLSSRDAPQGRRPVHVDPSARAVQV